MMSSSNTANTTISFYLQSDMYVTNITMVTDITMVTVFFMYRSILHLRISPTEGSFPSLPSSRQYQIQLPSFFPGTVYNVYTYYHDVMYTVYS